MIIFLYLVGTKADVNKDKYIVDNSVVKKCKEYNMKYFETSTKKIIISINYLMIL